MIFEGISRLENRSQKAFFIEKIDIMTRIIEEFCSLNNYSLDDYSINYFKIEIELVEIGIIVKSEDFDLLKGLLQRKFKSFCRALNFYIINKELTNFVLDKFYNNYRASQQRLAIEDFNAPTLIDFFAGAGGLSLGFIQEGFRVKLANDVEDVCVETYKLNHPDLNTSRIIKDDIRNVVESLDNLIKFNKEIDLVIGGPPCQGFSSANQQRIIDDPRNELYKYYIKAIAIIKPKFVVMENVKGMLKVADQVVEDFNNVNIIKNGKNVSYNVAYNVFNSHDFSVAQNRKRLIYIGIRSDIQETQNISPEQIIEEIKNSTNTNQRFDLKDALELIKPLDATRIKNMTENDSEESGKKVDKNIYFNKTNEYLRKINNGSNSYVVFNHKARYCSDVNYEIYKRLDQGEDSTSDKIADIMPYAHRNHVFKDKYFKLIENKPSRTITAHMKMDCHSHIHPTQVRSLTPREAARVQSFPDDYIFLGAYLKTYMQIGNAVPPLMSRGIAKVIKKYI
ncbi:DNA cytosine methyltransferase [Clostridium estertheticum]|uniref:DNA cytosine methyltransferase n=1 Tax=Clostridium estertheticum TaxID=238834 RepID=UPI001C0E452F|nr:DNA cytosine methyltransferase [Clostridium estertheticum]MBU3217447.1 DNA cytosine methyltransferase [Clostridium estertheticum]WAG56625.1 DNA cytosine methyltransferase [Clostridium estertheticum]